MPVGALLSSGGGQHTSPPSAVGAGAPPCPGVTAGAPLPAAMANGAPPWTCDPPATLQEAAQSQSTGATKPAAGRSQARQVREGWLFLPALAEAWACPSSRGWRRSCPTGTSLGTPAMQAGLGQRSPLPVAGCPARDAKAGGTVAAFSSPSGDTSRVLPGSAPLQHPSALSSLGLSRQFVPHWGCGTALPVMPWQG